MKKFLKKTLRLILTPFVFWDFLKFQGRDKTQRFSLSVFDFYPQIKDKTIKTNFDAHYVYHTSWAARKVKEINHERHTDISSSLFFSGIVSAFMPIDFYDYRPADLKLSNLTSNQVDLLKLPFESGSIKSLSCMHTVEHIGLGRYGDQIDPEGDLKAINELQRVLAKDGSLLFVVPVGRAKIEFNAHRIYSYEQVTGYFKDLELKEFTLVTDNGGFIENAKLELVKEQNCGCGCFWFVKK